MEHNELIGSVNGASDSAFISQKYSPITIVFKLFSHKETATILNKHMKEQIKLLVPHDANMKNYINIVI